LCDKGRFGFEAVNSADRLVEPLLRKGDELGPARWSDALDAAAAAIRAGLEGSRGAQGVAVIGGARLSNEAAYHWTKLAKGVIGTDHVDAQLGDGLPAELVLGLPAATIDDVCRPGGTVLYLGPDPKEALPVLFLRLRHAVERDGVKIVELAPVSTGLTPYAAASVRYRPGEAGAAVAGLLAGGDDLDAAAAAILAAAGDDLTVVLGRPTTSEAADGIVDAAGAVLGSVPGARFLSGLRRANVHGALDMGMSPGLLPGRVRRGDAGDRFDDAWPTLPEFDGLDTEGILRAAAEGKIDTLVLLGADPLADFPDRSLAERGLIGARTVIAVDVFLTESSRKAQIVLPASAFAEDAGTHTNLEGRVTRMSQQVTAAGTSRPDWLIASELAARLGVEFEADGPDAIWDEITTVSAVHEGVDRGLLASDEFVDGVVVPLPSTGTDDLIRFEAAPARELPAVDSYSHRLVSVRKLYDQGTLLQHSPSSAGLATDAMLHLHHLDLEQLGLADGGRVRVSANDRSFVVKAVADDGVPRGVAAIAGAQANAPVGNLIKADAAVTDVRLEVAG
jgi:NADH-quinone oxidoreductase subunit G